MNTLLLIVGFFNLAQSFPLVEDNGSSSQKGVVDNMDISHSLEDGEALKSGKAGQNQSSFSTDVNNMFVDELLRSDTDIQSHDHSTPEGVSSIESTLLNTRAKRASEGNQRNKRRGRRNKNKKRSKSGIDREPVLGQIFYTISSQNIGQ